MSGYAGTTPALAGGRKGLPHRPEILHSPRPLIHVTYLMTFGCYGCWLPGDARGSADRVRAGHRGGALAPCPALLSHSAHLMSGPAFRLTLSEAHIVLDVIHEVCDYRGWGLMAAHIRSTHVHVVMSKLRRRSALWRISKHMPRAA